jgi:serine/threonine protein kinase
MTDVSQDIFLEKSIPRISRLDKAELVGDSGHTFGCFGDIRFKAPEVCNGASYDRTADIWSFGIILYHLLTGRLPYDAKPSGHKSYSKRNVNEHNNFEVNEKYPEAEAELEIEKKI